MIYTHNQMTQIDLHWVKKYGREKLLLYLLSSSYYDYVSVYVDDTLLVVSSTTITQKCLGQTLTGMILS